MDLNFKKDFAQFTEVTAPTRCMFDGKNLTYEYVFRSLSQYYIFIVQQFIAAGYRVQRCNCCGRYFVPKTKKKPCTVTELSGTDALAKISDLRKKEGKTKMLMVF